MVRLGGGVDGGAVHHKGGGGGGVGHLIGQVGWVEHKQLGLGGHMGGVGLPSRGLGEPDQGLELVDVGGDQSYIVCSTNGGHMDPIEGDAEARGLGQLDGIYLLWEYK